MSTPVLGIAPKKTMDYCPSHLVEILVRRPSLDEAGVTALLAATMRAAMLVRDASLTRDCTKFITSIQK